MTITYGFAPGPKSAPVGAGRADLPGCLTLTAVSGGSTRWNGMGAADTVTSITVGGTEILGSTITYATSVAATCKTAIRAINAYQSPYWATFDGTDKILIWPRDGSSSTTATVATTESGFTATDVNMNTEQAFVAAVRWPSLNLGDDAFADTKMYRVGFDFSQMYSLSSDATITTAEGAEITFRTEDQALDVFIGSEGKWQLAANGATATAGQHTFSVLACSQGHLSLFLQSAAAQNPTYLMRIW